jgi:pimeloyl-ACP methyl ester carboxylesterase
MSSLPVAGALFLLLTGPLAAQPDSIGAPTIRWEPFALPVQVEDLDAQLGRMIVPLRRAHPERGSVELAFVRLQSGGAKSAAPIVYLAGGPGSSGVNAARNPFALPSLARLAKTADVVLLDQRGIGMSSPRPVCAAKPLEPQARFAPSAEIMPRILAETRSCVEEWSAKGVDVAGFTVAESAADVDDLRRALGASKISLLGHSYGTYLALAVIRAYGSTVERAALLATAGPADMRKLPLMLDTQLAKLSILAREDPSIGKEVPDMTALLRRVLAKLERELIAVTITDRSRKEKVQVRIGPEALQRILALDIGDGNDFPFFPALLLTIERGDASILAWFVEKRYNQAAGPNLMAYGMRCSGGATASRDREIAREAQLSILGNALNGPYPAVCEALPPVDPGDDFRTPIVSNVPVLFISGTLDSNTPPYQAEQVRWGMPHAMHIIVPNAGHEDLEPNEEVQAAIADYFAGQDVASRRIALPVPDFRSVDEAKRERHVE